MLSVGFHFCGRHVHDVGITSTEHAHKDTHKHYNCAPPNNNSNHHTSSPPNKHHHIDIQHARQHEHTKKKNHPLTPWLLAYVVCAYKTLYISQPNRWSPLARRWRFWITRTSAQRRSVASTSRRRSPSVRRAGLVFRVHIYVYLMGV